MRKRGAWCTRTPKNAFTAKDSAMASRPCISAHPKKYQGRRHLRPPGNVTQRARNGTPGAAAARLLPVAAAVAVSPRTVRAISPRVIHAVSPRAVRAISPRGQNASRIACARVRTASSSAPSSQQAA